MFSFERSEAEDLELIPAGVRRKLDLARQKLSLAGWTRLPREARMALVAAGDPSFEALLREVSEAAGVALDPLGPAPAEWPWRAREAPEVLRGRLDAARWAGLDDETRYSLWKLCESRRPEAREQLAQALTEI